MSGINLRIVKFCAEEVERQRRGPIQVFNMVEAWSHAIDRYERDKSNTRLLDYIQRWGHLIEPEKNHGEWRSVGVRVGDYICPRPDEVPSRMERWFELVKWDTNLSVTPEEAYREFLEVHPFVDGNGRCGKIIYSWLRGELYAPTMPPNFFNCANP